jgi:hypothetical protein
MKSTSKNRNIAKLCKAITPRQKLTLGLEFYMRITFLVCIKFFSMQSTANLGLSIALGGGDHARRDSGGRLVERG